MTAEQWDRLVRRLEPEARAEPARYGRKVALLAAAGYGFILLMLAALTALAAVVVWLGLSAPVLLFKVGLPIAALAWILARSLWVKLDAPTGVRLRKEDAPELHRMLEEVNEQVQGPKIHEVLVDGELNASVVQIPRPGLVFGQRNYLVLGLPLMQALSPEEFRAVVAHELGHLSRAHGRFAAWIYRIRATWAQLLANLEEKGHWGAGLFRRFFRWYVPYFDAWSFPLMRQHEFEADRAAVAVAGPHAAASALATLPVAGDYLERAYWPRLYERADSEEQPPRAAFAPLRSALAEPRTEDEVRACLTAELERPSETSDTHPCLSERVKAIGVDRDELLASVLSRGAPSTSAAESFLGETEGAILEELDRSWRESVGEAWRQRYEEVQEQRRALADLDALAAARELDLEEARARASLTAELRGADEGLALFRELLERAPDDAQANFAVGTLLLDRDDDAGLAHLERAMEADPDAILPACEYAWGYLTRHGRHDEAARYRERGVGRAEALELAYEERTEVRDGGPIAPHDLPGEAVAELRSQLAQVDGLKRAYLVRRPAQHLDDELPLYVLYLFPKRYPWRPLGGDRQELVERVDAVVDVPFQLWYLAPSAFSAKRLRLRRIAGAEIYTA